MIGAKRFFEVLDGKADCLDGRVSFPLCRQSTSRSEVGAAQIA